jgi:hypothetical protein
MGIPGPKPSFFFGNTVQLFKKVWSSLLFVCCCFYSFWGWGGVAGWEWGWFGGRDWFQGGVISGSEMIAAERKSLLKVLIFGAWANV